MPISNAPATLNDHELLKQVSGGDEDAFKELYARYNLPIFNHILRIIYQVPVAEDILQETFIAIWQGANKFRGKSSVKTWIFRIAHYQTVSWLRKHKRSERVFENIDNINLLSNDPQLEEQLMQDSQVAQIQSALEQLSPNHRSVVELTFVHGFTYKEIAKIMGCPVGTVKSRMSYAIKYINADLSRKGN